MDGHLAKPFEPETLLATVTRTVGAACRQRKQRADPDSAVDYKDVAREHYPEDAASRSSFDIAIFERTRAVLTPETSSAYLRKLDIMCGDLLSALRTPRGCGLYNHDLAVSAHMLAGSAGMFGFLGLASVGRQFERDVLCQAEELPALAETLCQELALVQKEIRSRVEPAG